MAYKKKEKLESLSSIVVSSPVCAEFFGISQRYLREWKNKGCPNEGHGLWKLHEVFLWWQDTMMSSKSEESDKDLSGIKKDYWIAKTRVEVVKAETLEEKFLPREAIGREWAKRAGIYKAGLLAFASRLPPLLQGKKQLEMRRILTDEASTLLASLSGDHKFCPRSKIPKEYANLENLMKKVTTWVKPKKKKKRSSSGPSKKRS